MTSDTLTAPSRLLERPLSEPIDSLDEIALQIPSSKLKEMKNEVRELKNYIGSLGDQYEDVMKENSETKALMKELRKDNDYLKTSFEDISQRLNKMKQKFNEVECNEIDNDNDDEDVYNNNDDEDHDDNDDGHHDDNYNDDHDDSDSDHDDTDDNMGKQ
ncbi:unnamed protein product [Chilo suppressalis]|uniref:Uncharacterized protein n=1 Tax=Chilo suppressalis TaxID=168631 RepID=A0ABN8B7M5_CHISP|nr:unnamed protein product [Chilo suppressalis]